MTTSFRLVFRFALCLAVLGGQFFFPAIPLVARQWNSAQEVAPGTETIVLIQGASKRLKFNYDIPELMVENPEIVQATPMRIDEIMISGLRPGHTSLTVSDANQQLQTVRLIVEIDTRPVELALRRNFPDSNIRVNALQTGIVLHGEVARPEQIETARLVAQDYFASNVISLLQVQGAQNIAIQVKVYEVSRTKLRRLGVDWQINGERFGVVSNVSKLITSGGISGPIVGSGQDFAGGILTDSTQFAAFMQALEQRNVAKIVDQPVLIAQNGRPAEFLAGGEVPFLIQQGLGNSTFEFRSFGTKLDLVPIVEGQGYLTLEVRAEVSQVADDLGGDSGLPGFRVRRVNTGVKMRAGHTLALAGDFRETSTTSVRGIPKIMDRPAIGSLFRRVQDEFSETELVFLITPNFISDVDPSLIPMQMPGTLTQSPSNRELYLNAHVEVPKCVEDCPIDSRLTDRGYIESGLIHPYPADFQTAPGVGLTSPEPGLSQRQEDRPSRPPFEQPAAHEARKSGPHFGWPGTRHH